MYISAKNNIFNWQLWCLSLCNSVCLIASLPQAYVNENEEVYSSQTWMIDVFLWSSGTCASSPEQLNVGDDDPADLPTVEGEVSSP
jgi:hypothetical protein